MGRNVTGAIEHTFVRGNLVYSNNQFVESPKGEVLLKSYTNLSSSDELVKNTISLGEHR